MNSSLLHFYSQHSDIYFCLYSTNILTKDVQDVRLWNPSRWVRYLLNRSMACTPQVAWGRSFSLWKCSVNSICDGSLVEFANKRDPRSQLLKKCTQNNNIHGIVEPNVIAMHANRGGGDTAESESSGVLHTHRIRGATRDTSREQAIKKQAPEWFMLGVPKDLLPTRTDSDRLDQGIGNWGLQNYAEQALPSCLNGMV